MTDRNIRKLSTFQNFRERIEILARFLDKTVAELEKGRPEDYPDKEDRLLGNATISGWYTQPLDWTSSTLEKFLSYWKVNPEWWKTGEGEIILTRMQKSTDNKESALGELDVYRKIFEGKTEYIVIPRTVLEKTQLVSIDELERKNGQIDLLIKMLGVELAKVPSPKDNKKKT